MKKLTCLLVSACLWYSPGIVFSAPGNQVARGLNPQATQELQDAGLDKYLGQFTPVASFDVGRTFVRPPSFGYQRI